MLNRTTFLNCKVGQTVKIILKALDLSCLYPVNSSINGKLELSFVSVQIVEKTDEIAILKFEFLNKFIQLSNNIFEQYTFSPNNNRGLSLQYEFDLSTSVLQKLSISSISSEVEFYKYFLQLFENSPAVISHTDITTDNSISSISECIGSSSSSAFALPTLTHCDDFQLIRDSDFITRTRTRTS
jgi:hypothetical protein